MLTEQSSPLHFDKVPGFTVSNYSRRECPNPIPTTMTQPRPFSRGVVESPRLPRLFHVTYPCLIRGEECKLARQRDTAAFAQLMNCAARRGWDFDTLIFNYAAPASGAPPIEPDLRFLRPDDLLLLTTRPPLHDPVKPSRKFVPQSGTRFEKRIFDAVGEYLSVCSRTHMRVQDSVVRTWEHRCATQPGGLRRATQADFRFCQNCDARLRAWNTLNARGRAHRLNHGSDYRSLGWFIHVPHIAEFGCRLIVCFGMGSFESLVWSRIVRTRFDHWFDEPGFALAEMDLNGLPQDPATLHFADAIPVKLLMRVPAEKLALSA